MSDHEYLLAYWGETLKKNSIELDPIRKKLYDNVTSLTTEELYVARDLLTRNASLIVLLNEEIARTPAPKKPWYKIFTK